MTEAAGASAETTGPTGRKRAAAMPFIMLTVLLDMIAIGLIIPVLPPLVGTFTGSQADHAFWYGVVTFSFGLANFFGAPILGALSDQYGRRPVLLVGLAGLACSFFVTALATALWMLVAVRVFSGALQANAAVAQAYVADISTAADRGKRFGMLGAMFGMGFVLGPVMGGLLGGIDLRLPFFAAGTLAVLNTLYGIFVLPESLAADRRTPINWKRANPIASFSQLRQLHGVGMLVAVIGLSGLAQFILHTTWVLYTTFKFGWGPQENGWSLFAVGAMSVLVQGGLIRVALKRSTPQRIAVIGLVSSSLSYLLWGAATEGWMMYAVIGLNVFGFMVQTAIQTIVSGAADEQSQGRTLGAVASINSLTAVVAPIIGAGLLGIVSHLPRGDWRIGAPFFLCSALQLVAMVLALRHFRRHPAHSSIPTPGTAAVTSAATEA
ncbi:major facilitator superfamily MFS_1 [Leptothrix cholodnii SP-6]|uniref:Major facilitator superfamily MFS_1 n=2 Tax=Leptothrix cholodnii TaxID=34029 RepID=B1Y230_LEPCP|nr:major facilitator superfamily MFS_1 [Leptothrix cholodnii SP-6]